VKIQPCLQNIGQINVLKHSNNFITENSMRNGLAVER
jgi:hypothetical protein